MTYHQRVIINHKKQLMQSLMEVFGKGIGEGTLNTKVPEAHTDYVISVISEEFGILFILLILMIFLILIFKVFKKIPNEKKNSNKTNFNRLNIIDCISSINSCGCKFTIASNHWNDFTFFKLRRFFIIELLNTCRTDIKFYKKKDLNI